MSKLWSKSDPANEIPGDDSEIDALASDIGESAYDALVEGFYEKVEDSDEFSDSEKSFCRSMKRLMGEHYLDEIDMEMEYEIPKILQYILESPKQYVQRREIVEQMITDLRKVFGVSKYRHTESCQN